jgi:hypothetical protein
MEMDQAIREAIALNETVSRTGLDAAYSGLENAMRSFEKDGYPIEAIIPGKQAAALGFSLKGLSGNAFFEAYARLIRKSLCTPEGEFNKLIRSGLSSSVGAVLTVTVTALGIPMVALGVMIPVAVIIANTGLEAFCAVTERPVTSGA